MYRELKKQIADRELIKIIRSGIEERIQFKIDKQLGFKGMTFQDVKIEMKGMKEDKFLNVFASIESLEKDKDNLEEEEKIIEDMLDRVDAKITELNEIEHKVFRGMYLWGLTQQAIADRIGLGIDRVKQISMDINKKIGNY